MCELLPNNTDLITSTPNNDFDFDLQMKAKSITDALSVYDLNDSITNEVQVEPVTKPLLVAKITNGFEAEFLVSLCKELMLTNTAKDFKEIELCVKYDNVLKPVGTIPLTFNAVQSIHSYNSEIVLGIFFNNKLSVLEPFQEICLP